MKEEGEPEGEFDWVGWAEDWCWSLIEVRNDRVYVSVVLNGPGVSNEDCEKTYGKQRY